MSFRDEGMIQRRYGEAKDPQLEGAGAGVQSPDYALHPQACKRAGDSPSVTV